MHTMGVVMPIVVPIIRVVVVIEGRAALCASGHRGQK